MDNNINRTKATYEEQLGQLELMNLMNQVLQNILCNVLESIESKSWIRPGMILKIDGKEYELDEAQALGLRQMFIQCYPERR